MNEQKHKFLRKRWSDVDTPLDAQDYTILWQSVTWVFVYIHNCLTVARRCRKLS